MHRRQDEGKLKELRLAVERLTQKVAAAKAALDVEMTDTQAAQVQLDRAATDFRTLHSERRMLLQQWDEARAAMSQRDEAIQVRADHERTCTAMGCSSQHVLLSFITTLTRGRRHHGLTCR